MVGALTKVVTQVCSEAYAASTLLDEELDDHRVVGGGFGGAGSEQPDGPGAPQRERTARGSDFGEVGDRSVDRCTGDPGVEVDHLVDVGGDDADGDEVHARDARTNIGQ